MFAKKLNALCASVSPRVTNVELVQALTVRGSPVSTAYLSQLRNNKRTCPAPTIVSGLADFFDIPVDYFYATRPPVEHAEADLDVVARLQQPELRQLLVRTHGLSQRSRDLLSEFTERFRRAENLPLSHDAMSISEN